MEYTTTIKPVSGKILNILKSKIDHKTKPVGSLGVLEKLAIQIGSIQQTTAPQINKPALVVFAGDHGITEEGVSPYPQKVTYQMVMNFLNQGAAVNVLANQNGLDLLIVDAGVNFDFKNIPSLIHRKVGPGTGNFLHGPAMSNYQLQISMQHGAEIIEELYLKGCNTVGFGEMGIGNTSSSSVITSILCEIGLEDCVGPGTGLNVEGVEKKRRILEKAINFHSVGKDPLLVLQTFGGFEIVMMCGAMLKAASLGMVLLIDGFITSAALLAASELDKNVLDYCIFCHQSEEKGHAVLLQKMNATPLLNLQMRLGEGSGVAVAFPIILSSVSILNQMASFESAGVSNKS